MAVDGSDGRFEPEKPPPNTAALTIILKTEELQFGAMGAQTDSEGKNKMPNSTTNFSKLTTVVTIALFGSVLGIAAEPAAPQNVPMVKNLTALTYRAPAVRAAVPQELKRSEVKKLAATAKSTEDHLKIAGYYNAKADKLEASAARYEEASASYSHGPMVKNLMSPTTPVRYAFIAKGFREEASSNRALAASHEQMAKNTAAGF